MKIHVVQYRTIQYQTVGNTNTRTKPRTTYTKCSIRNGEIATK